MYVLLCVYVCAFVHNDRIQINKCVYIHKSSYAALYYYVRIDVVYTHCHCVCVYACMYVDAIFITFRTSKITYMTHKQQHWSTYPIKNMIAYMHMQIRMSVFDIWYKLRYICIDGHACTRTYTHMSLCLSLSISLSFYIYIYMCVCVCIYIYIYI